MRVTLLGTGYAIPTAERVHTSLLVETNENLLLFDCGSGVLHRIAESGYDTARISAIFFTHHHLDHDSDFLSLMKANWLKGRNDMRIYGPEGTKDWLTHLLGAYPYLQGRLALDVEEVMNGGEVRLGKDVVSYRTSAHGFLGLAYKVSSAGSSMVYSGDTEPCDAVAQLSKGAGLLVHECNVLVGEADGHSTPLTLGKLLEGIELEKLVLVHLPPEIESPEIKTKVLQSLSGYFKGEIIIGSDLLRLEL
ncbi:MAG: MBL fold metallo-hydrolase [Candidatus Hydrothermarchaeales archaeon]